MGTIQRLGVKHRCMAIQCTLPLHDPRQPLNSATKATQGVGGFSHTSARTDRETVEMCLQGPRTGKGGFLRGREKMGLEHSTYCFCQLGKQLFCVFVFSLKVRDKGSTHPTGLQGLSKLMSVKCFSSVTQAQESVQQITHINPVHLKCYYFRNVVDDTSKKKKKMAQFPFYITTVICASPLCLIKGKIK